MQDAQTRQVSLSGHAQDSALAASRPSAALIILALALVLRLGFVLLVDPTGRIEGGDTAWMLSAGRELVENRLDVAPQAGPGFLVFAGLVQVIVGPLATVSIVRLLHALLGTALVGFVLVIGTAWIGRRAGQIAALVVAINPIFVIEAGQVLTESLFLFLLFAGLAAYAWSTREGTRPDWRAMALTGALFGLAALTRAVILLLPLVLVVHLLALYRRRALRWVAMLLLAYALTLSTWTIYNLARWNRFVIGAEGIAANIFIGTTEGWCGPECIDKQAGITPENGGSQETYIQSALDRILADPLGYVRLRLSNVLGASLQPHNTVYYPGESIKDLFGGWWATDRSLGGLFGLTGADNFWPKLAIYIFHFAALIFGLAGAVVALRRRFWALLPLYGFLAYFYGLHTILTAIPRYLFPTQPVWWLFAGLVLAAWSSREPKRKRDENATGG